MTADESRQIRSSLLAIILCILFLWTGKKFIWNAKAEPDTPQPTQSSSAELIPDQTGTTTSAARGTSLTQNTTTAAKPVSDSGMKDTTSAEAETASSETTTVTTSTTAATTAQATEDGLSPAPDGYFDDALFIGDSRTVGLAKYAPIEGAEYFATVGMNTQKLNETTSEVGEHKNLTFAQLLASRKFGKIYLMIGINEIGNNRTVTLQKYQEIVGQIRKAQPDARLIIEANLHVAQSRSSTDPVINNEQINSFNAATAQLADGTHIFYLDVNPHFDDENGALGAEFTHDGTHPLAKYYKDWSEWLTNHAIL